MVPPTYDSVVQREVEPSVPLAHGTTDETSQTQGTNQVFSVFLLPLPGILDCVCTAIARVVLVV